MRRPSTLILVMTAVLLAGGSITPTVLAGTDPGAPDSLFVDSVVAYRNGIGVVPVYFTNDVEITAVEVTLRQSTSQIDVDSFSFEGGRFDFEGASHGYAIGGLSTIVSLYASPGSSALPPGRGLLGHLYYSYPQSITPQTVTIDTITTTIGAIVHSTWFRGPDAAPYKNTIRLFYYWMSLILHTENGCKHHFC